MPIERTEKIQFHIKGTLDAVTRWIDSHPTGIAEWLKNARRQYQDDRANVPDEFRAVAILFQDAKGANPARIGLLDVGGATLEDVTSWEVWQDPEASRRRGSQLEEEHTQGNGGKAYMFRMFVGPARILGVRNGRRNDMGFEGPPGTEERGTPGWIPDAASARDLEISSFEAELRRAIEPYGITISDLPSVMQKALKSRQAFTLVEGVDPVGCYKGGIEAEELLAKVVRHEQAILCFEQLEVYAFHNGRAINDGKKLTLPPIRPYPGLESPHAYEIPDQLPLENGQLISTTESGAKSRGRLLLHTSADNMYTAYKTLRPRRQIVYRTKYQMIGAKSVAELVQTPGVHFVYGVLELPALEPAYVEHGRGRPKNGPLTEATDLFIADKIRELAHEINVRRKHELDDRALDDVHRENQGLDDFKNQFLPDWGEGAGSGRGSGTGGGGGGGGYDVGTVPDSIDYAMPADGIELGKGISLQLKPLLSVVVRDAKGHPVVNAKLVWSSSDERVASIDDDGNLTAHEKGDCEIWAQVRGTKIQTERILVRVWNVDHVLLTPRTLEIPLGKRAQIVAEVTDDDGRRSTLVYLEWKHDADDPLIVRIGKGGVVTGNRIGRTSISAGAGEVWARTPVDVKVVPNAGQDEKGSGFPRLLVTDRDVDPATGEIREGDPDSPALWQETTDVVNNLWWLNLQSPEAAFAFRQRSSNPVVWRTFHAERLVDMVVQVWMADEFTRKGLSERPEPWLIHSQAINVNRVLRVQEMWKRLEGYVNNGTLSVEE